MRVRFMLSPLVPCLSLVASGCPDGSSNTETTQATTSSGVSGADPSGTGGQQSTGTGSESGTGSDTGGAGPHAICERYLQCVAVVAPGDLPTVQMGYGDNGMCWQGSEADAQLCLDACQAGLEMFNDLFPEEPKCGLCQDHSECDMAAGELCHLGKCEVTTCGDGIVDDQDICDGQPQCDLNCQGPQDCNPISNFGCMQDEVCTVDNDGHEFVYANCRDLGDPGAQVGAPCIWNNDCHVGLVCACQQNYPACESPGVEGICASYCDLGAPNPCPDPLTCVPYEDETGGLLPPELGFLGVCVPA
ncbi:hypothetical protein [Nannocystis punicea]|uniref:Uncharacterized protein n=1 Tax=Nannocystis punicea TaxID=2995304 RepID=A0ABY7GVH4_9BACT|nr:hypothetical protein [Nannocystis poenicansa]WAS90971.1 hypothetical protein O0S08_32685 [Nannocystis poenicansa]